MQCAGRRRDRESLGNPQRIGTQLLEVGNSSFAVANILSEVLCSQSTAKYLQRDFSKNENVLVHIDNIFKLEKWVFIFNIRPNIFPGS